MTSSARQGSRLADESFAFTFDGRKIPARRGDTAASALLAHGVRLMGRSVKYRRVRGVLTADFEEPNALFAADRAGCIVPNLPAPALAVEPGLVLSSQNRWPTLRYDLSALLQLGAGMLGAGFYYKTFIWPSWRTYEGLIRRLAGLGPAPRAARLPQPAIEHLDCDVLIAGGGPAGLAAASRPRASARAWCCARETPHAAANSSLRALTSTVCRPRRGSAQPCRNALACGACAHRDRGRRRLGRSCHGARAGRWGAGA